MPERIVKTTLIIDEHGAVKAVHGVGEESGRTEHKLGQLDKSVRGLGHSFGGLKSLLVSGVGFLGVSSAAFGLKSVIDNTKEALEQTEKFSAISGTGTQQSLYYTAALKARGINAEAAGKAFAFLGSNIKTAERQEHGFAVAQGKATAKGKITTSLLGKQAEAFKQLLGSRGVGALAGLSGEQKLSTVVQAFEKLPEAIKRTGAQAALMKEIFGRGGLSLATVLQGGSTGLTHFTEVAKKFFPQIKGGQRGLEEWQTKNSEFHLGLEGLEFTLGMKIIPVLKEVEEWFTKVSIEVKNGSGFWGHLGHDVEGVAGAVKDVVGWLSKLGKTFNIPVGAGGLGAALMAFAGIKTAKHPVKETKTAAKFAKKGFKYLLEHPYLGPEALAVGTGAALPFGSALGFHAGVEAISPGYASQHSLAEIGRSFLGGQDTGGTGRTRAGGRAAHGAETPGEAALVAKAIESLKPTHDEHKYVLEMEGVKVAEGMLHNPRARRVLAEAVAIYAQGMTARK